jgi:hypothetical protein
MLANPRDGDPTECRDDIESGKYQRIVGELKGLGVVMYRRRTERPRSCGFSHNDAELASGRRSLTSRQAWRDELVRVSPNASAQSARR